MIRKLLIHVFVVQTFGFASTALAQYRSTASQVRELQARFDKLVELHEALVPMLEQLESQVRTVQQQMAQLDSSGKQQDAAREAAELQRRLAQLEMRLETTAASLANPRQFAKLQTEYDVLESRLSGLERRMQTLARQDSLLAAASRQATNVGRRSQQPTASAPRFIGCCPGCGARLVLDPDGAVRHWNSTSAYDYAAAPSGKPTSAYRAYQTGPYYVNETSNVNSYNDSYGTRAIGWQSSSAPSPFRERPRSYYLSDWQSAPLRIVQPDDDIREVNSGGW